MVLSVFYFEHENIHSIALEAEKEGFWLFCSVSDGSDWRRGVPLVASLTWAALPTSAEGSGCSPDTLASETSLLVTWYLLLLDWRCQHHLCSHRKRGGRPLYI